MPATVRYAEHDRHRPPSGRPQVGESGEHTDRQVAVTSPWALGTWSARQPPGRERQAPRRQARRPAFAALTIRALPANGRTVLSWPSSQRTR